MTSGSSIIKVTLSVFCLFNSKRQLRANSSSIFFRRHNAYFNGKPPTEPNISCAKLAKHSIEQFASHFTSLRQRNGLYTILAPDAYSKIQKSHATLQCAYRRSLSKRNFYKHFSQRNSKSFTFPQLKLRLECNRSIIWEVLTLPKYSMVLSDIENNLGKY